jgi:hypothetical protein
MYAALLLTAVLTGSTQTESDKLRDEIKASWGVLTKDNVRKELKITRTVLHSGVIGVSTRNVMKMKNEMNQVLGHKEKIDVNMLNRDPVRVTSPIVLRVAGSESEIDCRGGFYSMSDGEKVEHHVHAFESKLLSRQYSKLKNQSGTVQSDPTIVGTAFENNIESITAHFLFGADYVWFRGNHFKDAVFRRTGSTITATRAWPDRKIETTVFAPEWDHAVTSYSSNRAGRKTSFDATYERRHGIVVPVTWAIRFFENDKLITERSYTLDAFAVGDKVLPPQIFDYPADTRVIGK